LRAFSLRHVSLHLQRKGECLQLLREDLASGLDGRDSLDLVWKPRLASCFIIIDGSSTVDIERLSRSRAALSNRSKLRCHHVEVDWVDVDVDDLAAGKVDLEEDV